MFPNGDVHKLCMQQLKTNWLTNQSSLGLADAKATLSYILFQNFFENIFKHIFEYISEHIFEYMEHPSIRPVLEDQNI